MSQLTPAAFARQKGVNRSTVSRWIASGRVQLDEKGLINVAAAETTLAGTGSSLPHHVARVEQAQQQRELGLVAAPATGATPVATGATAESMATTQRLNKARADREEEQAAIAKMERLELAKVLVRRSDAMFVLEDVVRTASSLLGRLADRYTSDVLAQGGDSALIHKTLSDAGRDISSELSQQLRRRAEERL